MNNTPNDGAALIAAERKRQFDREDYTDSHDDQHAERELASAAACYLHELASREIRGQPCKTPPPRWPWAEYEWKPKDDPIRQLVIVGALVAAEIDRLQRLAARTKSSKT